MGFIADKQTLDDLNLLDRYSNGSVFALFNEVKTRGGGHLLEKMFRHPITDAAAINQRSHIFSYFQDLGLDFPLDPDLCGDMENFLHSLEQQNRVVSFGRSLRRKALDMIGLHEEYNLFIKGLRATSILLHELDVFFHHLLKSGAVAPFGKQITHFQSIYHDERFAELQAYEDKDDLPFGVQVKYSYVLGNVFYERMLELLGLVYELDVYISVSMVARLNKFSYATAMPAEDQVLEVKDCRYPGLKNAKGNDVRFDRSCNVLFITGANMAGKSTLMKSVGVAVYLAHMGFPVAAGQMKFSIKDGLFSSINLPDDINQGLSHFYAEVLRVKTVAGEVSRSKNLLVIFDELFKGTNVKDAFDATLAVTRALAEHDNCSFIISTHILEVAAELRKSHQNIQFSFMPTIMDGKVPTYPYTLKEGVSADRHGMMIIENEGILDMLTQ